MLQLIPSWTYLALLFSCQTPASASQTAAAAPEKTEKAAPVGPTLTMKREPFKIDLALDGIFESEQAVEVSLLPEAWMDLTVLEAVDQGTLVKKGDVLIKIETKKINEAIQDLEAGRPLALLALKQAEDDLKAFEKAVPLDLALAERSRKIAEEDLLRFIEKDRAFLEKNAHMDFKSMQNHLEYEMEELRQLEKMYKADDLTEETEEIVLKRQRDTVESVTFSLERAARYHDNQLQLDHPRQEESLKESTRRQALTSERTKESLPQTLKRRALELEKMRQDQAKSEERLEKMKKDRELLTVRAPADGVVYYGRSVRGSWSSTAMYAESLRRGGNLKSNDVFMTIVKPRGAFVRLAVPEKELHQCRPGLEGKAIPNGYPQLRLPVKVESVSNIPFSPGNFEARASVGLSPEAVPVMPGMACSLRFAPYLKKDALAAPVAALFADELDDDKIHVFVVKDGKFERRAVKVGNKNAKKAEILEGLAEGETILLENPEEKK